jgi:lysophospholipase L1-like esterase
LKSSAGIGRALVLAIAMLVAAEVALQARAQLRTGQSVLTAVIRGPSFAHDPAVDATLLRPNTTIAGARMTIVSNRYGLRGADFPPEPAPDETRIALLGASTVMGTYATTGQTSSEQLERLIAQQFPDRHIRVINAGIQGLTLKAQSRLLEHRLAALQPGVIFWYPGSNDVGCRAVAGDGAAARRPPIRIPAPALPSWVLSSELLVKNTRFVRERPGGANRSLVPDFDVEDMRATVGRVAGIARDAGAQLVLVTAAHSYRSDMGDRELATRAASALFFRPCYSPRELAARIDEFNNMLRDEARTLGLPLVDAAVAIPPDPRLFGDASHFSPAGERRFAEVLAAELGRLGI